MQSSDIYINTEE